MHPLLQITIFSVASVLLAFIAMCILDKKISKYNEWRDFLCAAPPLAIACIAIVVFISQCQSISEWNQEQLTNLRNTRFECINKPDPTIECLEKYEMFIKDSVFYERHYGNGRRERAKNSIDSLKRTFDSRCDQ